MELSECRENLDRIDKQLLELFEERMDMAKHVAEYKIANSMAVLDTKREEQKLDSIMKMCDNGEYEQSAVELFTQIMSMSRKLQYKMIAASDPSLKIEEVDGLDINENTKVAFFGVNGSYTEQAMINYFGESINGISCATFEQVMQAVKDKEVDFGVLPIENTSTGAITGIHPLLYNYDNYIIDEIDVPIEQALLVVPGTRLEEIDTVYSHQQGLLQCKKFLDENPQIKSIEHESTAAAAKKVKEDGNKNHAAISSARTAKVYGLEVLIPKISYNSNNTTRFIIVSNREIYKKNSNRISLCFEIAHKSGSLYRILSHFIYNNINMTKIESCPIVGQSWEYRFFVDIEGNLNDSGVKNALTGIRQEVTKLELLGTYFIPKDDDN